MSRPRRLLDDCFLTDRERLRHEEALGLLRQRVRPIASPETVALGEAGGRILAEDVPAPRDVPAFDNAAVDGYALAHASLEKKGPTSLCVSARIAAGEGMPEPLAAGTAARIFTGAPMPEGADTVVMQEDVEAVDRGGESRVTIPPGVRQGANCRLAGEDQRAGEPVVRAGDRLRPQEIAAIASAGHAEVAVYERLRVALVSTGDELIRPGAPLEDGQVYDSNHFLLRAALETAGAHPVDLGVLPDREDAVREALVRAAREHHVIISTGGASRGEEDHVVETLQRIGTLHAWQIAVKPGRPLAFGQIGDSVFLGLPGNPVAVAVCFLLYARPVLARLQGAHWPEPRRYPLPAAFEIPRKKPDRREFLRGILETDAGGRLSVGKFPRDGSGLISSLTAADGLIELAEETTAVRRGDMVGFIPFGELGLPPR